MEKKKGDEPRAAASLKGTKKDLSKDHVEEEKTGMLEVDKNRTFGSSLSTEDSMFTNRTTKKSRVELFLETTLLQQPFSSRDG